MFRQSDVSHLLVHAVSRCFVLNTTGLAVIIQVALVHYPAIKCLVMVVFGPFAQELLVVALDYGMQQELMLSVLCLSIILFSLVFLGKCLRTK